MEKMEKDIMANKEKANEKLVLSIVPADNLTAYNCALEVARRKDEYYKILLDAKDEDIVQCEMSMFERICQVCRYRCAKIGDTYKCAYEKSFGTLCNSNNCEFLK